MGTRRNVWHYGAFLAALAGCTSEPALVASNCDNQDGCVSREPLKIDAVDILLVIDDSRSIVGANARIKTELPRMLNAITTGQAEDLAFPPAKSVHVAVTTTDMGVGEDKNLSGCTPWGRDGTFVKPDEFGLTCDVDYPGYLAFEGGPAPVATIDSVGCIPLVIPQNSEDDYPGRYGCGFEQPLEASLKALLPADAKLSFVHGSAHGDQENEGFLRDNSLLVVIVVTDEDDCSASDYGIFDPAINADGTNRLNAVCHDHQDKLFDAQRYVDNLKQLRPNNDNVVFSVIGGVPTQLTLDAFRSNYDLSTDAGARAYYEAVLDDPAMQETIQTVAGESSFQLVKASCIAMDDDGDYALQGHPPRRLLEVAKGFGARSVIGSLCDSDFGATAGRLIRTIGEQLAAASEN